MNGIFSERMKFLHYTQKWTNLWYWRTKEQKEIDCIEESDGQITAYEFKWNSTAKYKTPKLFLDTYQGSQFKIIHQDNLEEYLM